MAKGFKTGGRVAGSTNRLSGIVRDTLRQVLCYDFTKIQEYLAKIDDPKEKLELLIKFLPYICSKVAESSDDDDGQTQQSVRFVQYINKPPPDNEEEDCKAIKESREVMDTAIN